MRKREIAKVVIVSYNFNTKETKTKEFLETSKVENPIHDAEEHLYKILNNTHSATEGWQHKIFANKKAEKLRRKVWNNLD